MGHCSRLRKFALWSALVLLFGCANGGDLRSVELQSGLPALPFGHLDPRLASVVQTSSLSGSQAIDKSTGASAQGSALVIASAGATGLEWALWRFTPSPGASPLGAEFGLTAS